MITIEDALIENRQATPDWLAQRQELRARFEGCLPAEEKTRNKLEAELERQFEEYCLIGRGRLIDLVSLLALRDKHRKPIWTVANPCKELSLANGGMWSDGRVCVFNHRDRQEYIHVPMPLKEQFTPIGIPNLPNRIRELCTDKSILDDVEWLGILFQPEEWVEFYPDPAIVCQWRGLPDGLFHCLAIWGHDGPRIEEFLT